MGTAVPKQRLEKVTGRETVVGAIELETCIPVRRRSKFPPCLPIATELIISGALLWVLEDLICFAHFFKFRLSVGFFTHIGVELARQLAVSPLDLILGNVLRNTQDVVIIFEYPISKPMLSVRFRAVITDRCT